MVKYVKLSDEEFNFGNKNLLQSQIEIISLIKHAREYKKHRRKELLLKIEMRGKIEEALNVIDELDKILPKDHIKEDKETTIKDEEALTLEQELDRIKGKLSLLQ